MRRVAELWGKLSEKEKEPYVNQSSADKLRYQTQFSDLKEKGYFNQDDGTKKYETSSSKRKSQETA